MDHCLSEPAGLLTVPEARQILAATISAVSASETVRLKQAAGRVLSESVNSPINLPFDDNASMDGYAFASSECRHGQAFSLELAGVSWAGQPFAGAVPAGQCVRIFTGAVLPKNTDSVIMQEQVRAKGSTIYFPAQAPVYNNIRTAGEDIKQGELLCPAGKKLTAYDIGLLASAGIYQISVKRKIRIAFFSTGDELRRVDQPLDSGKIYDSNRYLLADLLNDRCFSVSDCGIFPDDKLVLEKTLLDAANLYDVIITTGGASIGDADFIQEILANCGQINFWKLAIKPGKPLAFGSIGPCLFFGLPGNPISVVVTFQQILAPALRLLSGAPVSKPLRVKATCTSRLKKIPGRLEFQRGILTQNDDGDCFVASAGKQGSHILGSLSRANCFIVLPADCAGVPAGGEVIVEPFATTI